MDRVEVARGRMEKDQRNSQGTGPVVLSGSLLGTQIFVQTLF